MNKHLFHILVFFCILVVTSCYTDDSSQPSPSRLPFEDFSEFFDDNNAKVDTLTFNADQAASLVTLEGININIPENAFDFNGDISLEIKEATSKSDFILLNKETIDGSTILESSGAISINPFTSSGPVNIDNPFEVRINLPSGTTGEDMQFYNYQNGWTLDNGVDVQQINSDISFETDRKNWQMGAKSIGNNGSVQLTVNAVGYGTVPHDIKAFVVLADYNSVIALDSDASTVSATGAVPKDVAFDVVIMVMDHFRLNVGVQTMTLSANSSMDIQVEKKDVDEMIVLLQGLD